VLDGREHFGYVNEEIEVGDEDQQTYQQEGNGSS